MNQLTCLALGALCGLATAQDDLRTALEPAPESSAAQAAHGDAKAQRTLAIYDVADLADPFRGGELDDDDTYEPDSFRGKLAADRLKLLARGVREYIRPKFVQGMDELHVHGSTTWVVSGTAEQHAWIRQFLSLQRDDDAPYLQFVTQQVRGTSEQFERLGFHGPTELLSDAASAQVATSALTSGGESLEILSSPKLSITQGTPAELAVMEQVAYVKSYEVVYVHPGPVAIADPVIDVIHEGLRNKFAGLQIEPGLYALDIEVERTEIERPIPTKQVQVAIDATTPMTISQPTVLSAKLSSTVLLRDGAGVWFRIPDGEQEMLILVQMDLVTAAEHEPGREFQDVIDCPVERAGETERFGSDEDLPPDVQRAREVPR